jgi:flagellar biosynthesis/type III secretory pathway chaperone
VVHFLNRQLIDDLIDVLLQESKIYDEILKISKNKTNIIVEGKVNELEKIVKLEQTFVLQMARMEGQRERLVSEISGIIGIEPEKITIKSLVDYVDKKQGAMLKEQQEKIVQTVKELSSSNDLNSKLIKSSLDYISFSLNLFANAGNADNNYGETGEKQVGKERNFFDFKV